MSVWAEIDALKNRARTEWDSAEAELAALHELPGCYVGKLSIDDYGVWKVRCRTGAKSSELVTARGGGQLVERVKAFLGVK
jgi:hypothetical protein